MNKFLRNALASFLILTQVASAGLPPTTTKASGDSNPVTTFNFEFPNFTVSRTGVKSTFNVNSIAGGGTGAATKAAGFDALSPMTTSGDIIYGGASGTGTRLPKGTDGQVLTLGSGLPSWTNAAPNLAVSAVKTTTYSILTTDDVVLVDGTSAFTATLPTAVGVTGKQYYIKRVDQTLANAVTIATTSSQTLDGVTTRKLMTKGESFRIVSDGSNWRILDHLIPASLTVYTPTFTGFGTVSSVECSWWRANRHANIRCKFTSGTVTASTAAVSLPSGLTIDSSTYVPSITIAGNYVGNNSAGRTDHGGMILITAGAADVNFSPLETFGQTSSNTLLTAKAANVMAVATDVMALTATVPIANWEE
jgi:hypothetical protein